MCQFPEQVAQGTFKHTETPELPFEVVTADLFEFENKHYILTVDYYSRFTEVVELKDQLCRTTIQTLKAVFCRHGIPMVLRMDNGPQFSSEGFKKFCNDYSIIHKTSSLHTPHSNGEAERAVQTVKKLWSKAEDKYLALLDYRTTPLESVGLSPAQLLMGRRLRNKLPAARALLTPVGYDPKMVKCQLDKAKAVQKFYFDLKRSSKPRAPLLPGEEVRMQPHPGSRKWSPAVVVKSHSAPRSYVVDCGHKKYR